MTVRGPHHRELRLDPLEAHYAVHPTAPDRPLALQLEPELGEERHRGRQVANDDADVIHAFDRHASLIQSSLAAPSLPERLSGLKADRRQPSSDRGRPYSCAPLYDASQ